MIGVPFTQSQHGPVGADIDGFVSGPIIIRVGAPVAAARKIGPVSLPTIETADAYSLARSGMLV